MTDFMICFIFVCDQYRKESVRETMQKSSQTQLVVLTDIHRDCIASVVHMKLYFTQLLIVIIKNVG